MSAESVGCDASGGAGWLFNSIAEHKCSQCHATKWADDGKAVYRPLGRINTPGLLRGMVEQCNTELNMGLFPEEVTAIAAVLNRDHYRFGP